MVLHILENTNFNSQGCYSRPPADSIMIGRMLASLCALLLDKVDETTFETRERIVGPFKRVFTLLEVLSKLDGLISSAALVHLAQAASEKYAVSLFILMFIQSIPYATICSVYIVLTKQVVISWRF